MAKKRKRKGKKSRPLVRAFEGAQGSPQHPARPPTSLLSPDSANSLAGFNLRAWGRYLDENHDIAIAVLDDLIQNIVGTGISVEPTPAVPGRRGARLAETIIEAWEEWTRTPEVTGKLSFDELQRISARAWLRDGEFFAQHVRSNASFQWNLEEVRYRVEYLEADMVPIDSDPRSDTGAVNGIIFDTWKTPRVYLVYLENPYESTMVGGTFGNSFETKPVPAENMMHCMFARRGPQTRGVPIFHGIIRRLQDLKEYEESEQIAARVAASLCAFIRRSGDYEVPQNPSENLSGEHEEKLQAGLLIKNLLPGEDIGTINTSRPTSELFNYRQAQIRAIAAGTGTRYSSIARDYSGTYSSQRQELVEAKPMYQRLANVFVHSFVRPVYENWLRQAWLQGTLGRGLEAIPFRDLRKAEYIGPGLPWIDPESEIKADVMAMQHRLNSRAQIIRRMGQDPRKVDALIDGDPVQLELIEGSAEDDDQDPDGTVAANQP